MSYLEDASLICTLPRVPLKESAQSLSSIFVKYLIEEIKKSTGNANVKMQIYGDGSEGLITSQGVKYQIKEKLEGEYFKIIPDIFFTIHAMPEISSRPPLDIDADYCHDPLNIDDPGEIDVVLSLPKNLDDSLRYTSEIYDKLYPILVHEMQHSVQKMIYGIDLCGTSVNSLESHIFDYSEIDARIEEILSISPNAISDESIFRKELCKYTKCYLDRNIPPERKEIIYASLFEKMVNQHTFFYRQKVSSNDLLRKEDE